MELIVGSEHLEIYRLDPIRLKVVLPQRGTSMNMNNETEGPPWRRHYWILTM